MKQRLAVRAAIYDKGKILLLRRAEGRPEVVGKYELPGGVIEPGEEPEDALRRHVHDAAQLSIQMLHLSDVASYRDASGELQYIDIIYTVSLAHGKTKLKLSQMYDHYKWDIMQEIQHSDLTDETLSMLNLLHHTEYSSLASNSLVNEDKKTADSSRVIIYSDGGSRGNPGPSAAGFVVMDENEQVLHEGGVYLGITTNNLAEYHGVQLGLEKALELGAKRVDFRIDSMLVVNQMNGLYTIKNRELWPIHERIHELVAKFDKVSFTHIKREFNQLADGMVNKVLNAHAQSAQEVADTATRMD